MPGHSHRLSNRHYLCDAIHSLLAGYLLLLTIYLLHPFLHYSHWKRFGTRGNRRNAIPSVVVVDTDKVNRVLTLLLNRRDLAHWIALGKPHRAAPPVASHTHRFPLAREETASRTRTYLHTWWRWWWKAFGRFGIPRVAFWYGQRLTKFSLSRSRNLVVCGTVEFLSGCCWRDE